MKTKRILALLAAAVCLAMTACGSEDSSSKIETESKADTSSVAAQESSAEAGNDTPAESTENTGSTAAEPAASTAEAPAESQADEEPAGDPKPLSEIAAELTEAEAKSAELKKVGDFTLKGVAFKDDNIYTFKNEDEVVLYDFMGKELLGGKAEFVEKLGDTGLYIYRAKGTEATIYEGLFDAEGNEVVSADEKCGLFEPINDRYVMAFFPEAETTDENEAIYYATERQFSVEAKEGDVYYKGKVKVYDTQQRKFLENTCETYAPRYTAHDDFIAYNDDDYNTHIVSANDEKIELADGESLLGAKLITCYKNGKTYAYDHSKKLLFTTEYSLSALTNSDEFYSITDTDKSVRGIIHYTGTVIIEPKYKSVDSISGRYFSYATTDDYKKNGIVDIEGNELTKDEYKYITYAGTPGCFSLCKENGKYDLFNVKTGKTVYKDADYGFSEGTYITDGDKYAYYVISKDDTSLKLAFTGAYFDHHLLESNNEKTLYDLVTGEKVLDGYDKAYYAFGHVYTLKGDKVTVYEVN